MLRVAARAVGAGQSTGLASTTETDEIQRRGWIRDERVTDARAGRHTHVAETSNLADDIIARVRCSLSPEAVEAGAINGRHVTMNNSGVLAGAGRAKKILIFAASTMMIPPCFISY